jgi:hypothetical protein
MKSQRITGSYQRIKRWEHEEVLEAVKSRLNQTQGTIVKRSSIHLAR